MYALRTTVLVIVLAILIFASSLAAWNMLALIGAPSLILAFLGLAVIPSLAPRDPSVSPPRPDYLASALLWVGIGSLLIAGIVIGFADLQFLLSSTNDQGRTKITLSGMLPAAGMAGLVTAIPALMIGAGVQRRSGWSLGAVLPWGLLVMLVGPAIVLAQWRLGQHYPVVGH